MARDFLLKTIIQWLKNVFLVIGMAIILLTALISLYAQAADVNVYAEGIYTDDYLKLNIYADIYAKIILSFGVKLTYNPSELSVTKAEKKEDVWCFSQVTLQPDVDNDGYTIDEGYCDDENPAINPGAIEVCDDLDNNYDTLIDEEGAEGCVIYYREKMKTAMVLMEIASVYAARKVFIQPIE